MGKILYVVVIYGVSIEDCISYQSLKQCLTEEEYMDDIYVHDNTHNNVFLAAAYNEGLKYALAHGYEWMTLLDEDTMITQEYVDSIRQAVQQPQFGVLVPQLIDVHGNVLSPKKLYGVLTAFNSGLTIRCDIVEQIGGFNTDYPLDYLDHWLCRRLYDKEIPIEVLPVRMHHNLSVANEHYVDSVRYQSILSAERRFADEFGIRRYYKWHLTGRLMKWIITGHPFVKETFKALVRI